MSNNSHENKIDAPYVWEAIRSLSLLALHLGHKGTDSLGDYDSKFVTSVTDAFRLARTKVKAGLIDIFKDWCSEELAEIYSKFEKRYISLEVRSAEINNLIINCERELKRSLTEYERKQLHLPVIEGKTEHDRGSRMIAFKRVSFLFGHTEAATTVYRRKDKLFNGSKLSDYVEINKTELIQKILTNIGGISTKIAIPIAVALETEGHIKPNSDNFPLPSEIKKP